MSSDVSAASLDEQLRVWDFLKPQPLEQVATDMFELLGSHAVRSDHPRYFGLLNPPD